MVERIHEGRIAEGSIKNKSKEAGLELTKARGRTVRVKRKEQRRMGG